MGPAISFGVDPQVNKMVPTNTGFLWLAVALSTVISVAI